MSVVAQSLPIQNFTAIIPVERGLCVNVSRFPSSPITEEASGNAAFLYEQQLCCQLVDLREKIVGDCYDKYKAQLCPNIDKTIRIRGVLRFHKLIFASCGQKDGRSKPEYSGK